MNGSVSASNKLTGKLAEYDRGLKAARAEMFSLKEEVVRADTEKADEEQKVAEVCKETEQHMVRLNAALAGRNRAEKWKRLLLMESVIAVDGIVL